MDELPSGGLGAVAISIRARACCTGCIASATQLLVTPSRSAGCRSYAATGRGELARHAMAWAWLAASTAPRWRPAALVPQPDLPQVRHRPPSGRVWRRGLSPGLFG